MIVRLLTHEYLQEEYHETAYTRVVYLAPGPLAARLSHHTRHSIGGGIKHKLEFLFTTSPKINSGTKRKSGDSSQPAGPKKRKVSGNSRKAKGKMKEVEPDDQDDLGNEVDLEDISFLSDDEAPAGPSQKFLDKNIPDEMYEVFDDNLNDEDSTDSYGWSHSLREEPPARIRPHSKNQTQASKRFTVNIVQEGDKEVMELLSD